MLTGDSLSEITIYPSGKHAGAFVCRNCRLIETDSDSRRIYDGFWKEREISIVIFNRPFFARRDSLNEWAVFQKLTNLQIPHCEALCRGKTEQGYWAIALEKIHSKDILSVFAELREPEKEFKLLISVTGFVAHLHIHGLSQKRPRLDCFSLVKDNIYITDTSEFIAHKEPIDMAEGLKWLISICIVLRADREDQIEALIRKYFSVRGLILRSWQTDKLLQKIRKQRMKDINSYLEMSNRSKELNIQIRNKYMNAVFSKDFCTEKQAVELPQKIDLLMTEGKVLKKDRPTFLSLVKFNERFYVIKRYNYQSVIHSLRHTIKGSRARRCWFHGHRLLELCIPTPKPMGFIEKWNGPLLYCSYLIYEYVEGPHLVRFLLDETISLASKLKVLAQAKTILHQFESYHITHGDLKGPNWIITQNGPALIDLDSVCFHRMGLLLRHRREKDKKRLKMFWDFQDRPDLLSEE